MRYHVNKVVCECARGEDGQFLLKYVAFIIMQITWIIIYVLWKKEGFLASPYYGSLAGIACVSAFACVYNSK